jgi:hypothetical protein
MTRPLRLRYKPRSRGISTADDVLDMSITSCGATTYGSTEGGYFGSG